MIPLIVVPLMCLWSLSPAVELPTDSLGVMNGCPVPLHSVSIGHPQGDSVPAVPPLELAQGPLPISQTIAYHLG